MAPENHFILYDCGIGENKLGNIYLDDMNITDYPMYKRAQHGIG
jgi:lipopolysaccharide export system ATP-binding protein